MLSLGIHKTDGVCVYQYDANVRRMKTNLLQRCCDTQF